MNSPRLSTESDGTQLKLRDSKTAPVQRRNLATLRPVLGAIIVIGALAGPAFLTSYGVSLIEQIAAYSLLAVSVGLLYGFAGMPSLGQAAYFGIGGYTAGVLTTKFGINSIFAVLVAVLIVTIIISSILALPAIRTKGTYFLLFTVAIAELLRTAATSIPWFSTSGVTALTGVKLTSFGLNTMSKLEIYYWSISISVILIFLAHWLTRSALGLSLRGLKHNRLRMDMWGYNTSMMRFGVFVFSGVLGAMGGLLYSLQTGIAVPDQFSIGTSALAFLMVIIGGVGRIYGAVIGAVAIVVLQYFVTQWFPSRWPMMLGILFIVGAVMLETGIKKRIRNWLTRRFVNRAPFS